MSSDARSARPKRILTMPVIRIRYRGKIHIRVVTRNYRGWYIMSSKGKEYWFKRDADGWNLIHGLTLPEKFIVQIAEQLEMLEGR